MQGQDRIFSQATETPQPIYVDEFGNSLPENQLTTIQLDPEVINQKIRESVLHFYNATDPTELESAMQRIDALYIPTALRIPRSIAGREIGVLSASEILSFFLGHRQVPSTGADDMQFHDVIGHGVTLSSENAWQAIQDFGGGDMTSGIGELWVIVVEDVRQRLAENGGQPLTQNDVQRILDYVENHFYAVTTAEEAIRTLDFMLSQRSLVGVSSLERHLNRFGLIGGAHVAQAWNNFASLASQPGVSKNSIDNALLQLKERLQSLLTATKGTVTEADIHEIYNWFVLSAQMNGMSVEKFVTTYRPESGAKTGLNEQRPNLAEAIYPVVIPNASGRNVITADPVIQNASVGIRHTQQPPDQEVFNTQSANGAINGLPISVSIPVSLAAGGQVMVEVPADALQITPELVQEYLGFVAVGFPPRDGAEGFNNFVTVRQQMPGALNPYRQLQADAIQQQAEQQRLEAARQLDEHIAQLEAAVAIARNQTPQVVFEAIAPATSGQTQVTPSAPVVSTDTTVSQPWVNTTIRVPAEQWDAFVTGIYTNNPELWNALRSHVRVQPQGDQVTIRVSNTANGGVLWGLLNQASAGILSQPLGAGGAFGITLNKVMESLHSGRPLSTSLEGIPLTQLTIPLPAISQPLPHFAQPVLVPIPSPPLVNPAPNLPLLSY